MTPRDPAAPVEVPREVSAPVSLHDATTPPLGVLVAPDAPRADRVRAAAVILDAAARDVARLLPDWSARDFSRAATRAFEVQRRARRRGDD